MGMEIVKVETLGTQNFHFPHSLIHGSLSLDIVYAWDHMGLCGCEADHQQVNRFSKLKSRCWRRKIV